MSYWLLFPLVAFTWTLLAYAAASGNLVRATRNSQQAGGVSLGAHIFMVAFMLLLAWVLDRGHPLWGLRGLAPWGSRGVGIFHALLVPVLLFSLLRDWLVLGKLNWSHQQTMDSIWSQLRDLFEDDDGSLPEIELTNLTPPAIPRIFAMLWRRGHDATAGGASYFDRGDGHDKPIASADDAANAAALVCNEEADALHVVLGGLECAGSSIPELGVFVHPDGLDLDYRMGSAWGPQQVSTLFALLFTIVESEPDLAVRHQFSEEAFDSAWRQYRDARRAI